MTNTTLNPVTPTRHIPTMSCVPLTPAHVAVLAALADRQPPPDKHADAFAELQAWGWVMQSGEFTGTGWAHVRKPGKGVL